MRELYAAYRAHCERLGVNPTIIGWCSYLDAFQAGGTAGRREAYGIA